MSRKRKQPVVLESIEITDVAAEGKSIAKVDGMVIFVPFVIPGDVVDLQLYRKKKSFAQGRVIQFRKYAEERVKSFCTHFGTCGGCKWQMMPYYKQLEFKQRQVQDQLERIAKVQIPALRPILGALDTQFYRNKLEFTFSNKRWLTDEEANSETEFTQTNALGFHIPGRFDKVLDISKCWLQNDISNQIRNEVRSYCLENNYTFFDLKNQNGLMRNLIIRTSSTGDIMTIVVFYDHQTDKIESLLTHLSQRFPQITSLLYIVNQKANDTITDQQVQVWKGADHIYEEMEGLKFKIGAKSFYQTNSVQAYNLYKITRNFAQISPKDIVYDLYTGTGTIANFVAHKAHKVVGIEYVPEAIEDAKINAKINGIENIQFYAGDMKDILNETFIEQHGRPNVIITDPPRAGMHDDVIKTILFAQPERIVYVSCNPATQARDISLLDEQYQVEQIQPVDMFPHTHHVENVILLVRRK